MGLKKTDILQAQLTPAFSDVLEASALRVTGDGYFAYITSRWESETGAKEGKFDGHLSGDRLAEIQLELEKLDFDDLPTIRVDDVGARELEFRHNGQIRRFELVGEVGDFSSPRERIFDEVWSKIHSVVEDTIRAEQAGADQPTAAVDLKPE